MTASRSSEDFKAGNIAGVASQLAFTDPGNKEAVMD
jgi:hypothetical protein